MISKHRRVRRSTEGLGRQLDPIVVEDSFAHHQSHGQPIRSVQA
jgi:hypothetical protein